VIYIFSLYQRGAGKSTPHACLEQNTTWDLIDDIEKLRKHLEIPEWQVIFHLWLFTNYQYTFCGSYVTVYDFMIHTIYRYLVGHGEAHLLLHTAKLTRIRCIDDRSVLIFIAFI
jgi:hypothetical protein